MPSSDIERQKNALYTETRIVMRYIKAKTILTVNTEHLK